MVGPVNLLGVLWASENGTPNSDTRAFCDFRMSLSSLPFLIRPQAALVTRDVGLPSNQASAS